MMVDRTKYAKGRSAVWNVPSKIKKGVPIKIKDARLACPHVFKLSKDVNIKPIIPKVKRPASAIGILVVSVLERCQPQTTSSGVSKG